MAKILSQLGVETSNIVEAWHVTQSIDAFTGTEAYDITLSGSLTLQNGTQGANKIATSDANGVISFTNSITASLQGTASYAITASYALNGGGGNATGSNYEIQFNKNGDFGATSSFKYNYDLQSLEHGFASTASGDYSLARGYYTQAEGDYSHAEGYINSAYGPGSHAEGSITSASGSYSHTEGYRTKTSGSFSHAEGYETISSGSYSHTEGEFTVAIGDSSHAEGRYTTASAYCSHTEGWGTQTVSWYQHAQGTYNLPTSGAGAFILGNGADSSNKSNLIFASGSTVEITGSLIVTSSALIIKNEILFTSQRNISTGGSTYSPSGFSRILLRIDGSTSSTLSDGTDGQILYLHCAQESTPGTHTITPSNTQGFTSIDFSSAGDTATLMFNGTKWYVISYYNATINP